MPALRRFLIPAPYWDQPGHLGATRVERFIRWLAEDGGDVTVVRAGSQDGSEPTEWGRIVTVRDPIGFYRDLPEQDHAAIPLRPKSALRRTVAYLLLVPDPLAAWARRAARHPLALEAGRSADLVLASSPPESVHLAAWKFANRVGARLVVDLRDGWLDEPMIPLLAAMQVQRWRHGRLEARVLRRAERIFVTSEAWRQLLGNRLPFTTDKTVVLTNACPAESPVASSARGVRRSSGELTLLYAGKLSSSRSERRVDQLMMPLVGGLSEARSGGRVVFIGNLDADERRELAHWTDELAGVGWSLEVRAAVPRREALELMASAGGLLLLSSSMASLPAKLFDYLASGRPILAVAPRGSATWKVAERLPQAFPVDPGDPNPSDLIVEFVRRCRQLDTAFDVPEEFTDAAVRSRFLGALEDLGA